MAYTKPARCGHCRYWRRTDPANVVAPCGFAPKKLAFWQRLTGTQLTHPHDGKDCPAFVYRKRMPHPLDHAARHLLVVSVGNQIPMRTYKEAQLTSHELATVLHVTAQKFITVAMLNGRYRIRCTPGNGERAGTVVGLPDWGVDMAKPIIDPSNKPREEMHDVEAYIASLPEGAELVFNGLGPFAGMTKRGTLGRKYGTKRVVHFGRKQDRVVATGWEAGLLQGEPWYAIDTTHTPQRS